MANKPEMRGYYEIGIYGNKTPENLGTLWRHAALYGASGTFTIQKRYPHYQPSDTMHTAAHMPLHHYTDSTDFFNHIPFNASVVAVELAPRSVRLGNFRHPEQAVYVLGAEDTGLPKEFLDRCTSVVQIECLAPYSMNVSSAGSILMYDRLIKAQRDIAERRAQNRVCLDKLQPHDKIIFDDPEYGPINLIVEQFDGKFLEAYKRVSGDSRSICYRLNVKDERVAPRISLES